LLDALGQFAEAAMAELVIAGVVVKDRNPGLGHAGFGQASNCIQGSFQRFALGDPFENALLPLE
jgi:hypothetical protein